MRGLWRLLAAFPETGIPFSIHNCGCVLSCSQPLQKAFRSILGCLVLYLTNCCYPRETDLVIEAVLTFQDRKIPCYEVIETEMRPWYLKTEASNLNVRHADACKFIFCSHRQKQINLLIYLFHLFSGSIAGPLLLVLIISILGYCLASKKKKVRFMK